MQIGPGDPPALFRVRWKEWSGWSGWQDVIDAPRVEEGCLVIKPGRTRMAWVPLQTIHGPIEIEALG